MRAFQLLLLCASACANVVLQSGWTSGSSSLDTGHTDEPAQLEPTQQRASAELSDYVDASGAFMQQFESHLREAGRSCKPSPFGMPSPSSRSIMRRPDRQALKQAFDHMSALHSQALSLARDSQLQAFASASLTLQQHLRVWLIDADKPTPASALLDEPTITALRSLRKACLKKPRGTVASTLETLGRELAEAEAASLALAHAALSTLDASQHGPRTSPAHSHRAEMERLEFEQLAQRAREAEEQLVELAAQFEAQAGQLRASKEGAHQAELVARGEVAAEVRGAAEEQLARERLGWQQQLARAQQELAHERQQLEAQRGLQDELAAARSQIEALQEREATALRQAAELSERLKQLEGSHAQLVASHRDLEQHAAARQQLEQQAAQRAHHLAQLTRELGPHGGPPVPLQQLREVQLEFQQLLARHARQGHQHAEMLEQLRRKEAELQVAAAHARELTHRMQLVSGNQRAAMQDGALPGGAPADPGLGNIADGLLSGLGGLTDAMKSRTRGLKAFSQSVLSDISGTVGAKPGGQV